MGQWYHRPPSDGPIIVLIDNSVRQWLAGLALVYIILLIKS